MLKSIYHFVKQIIGATNYDLERKYWSQYFPVKPQTINLLANDICNSRCQMCMIWKNKHDKELTPGELTDIIQDPLFSEVRHIGITGGEPTLRRDLALFYKAACESLPNLRGTSSITNAINRDQVIERISASAEICESYDVNFGLMVSLDGVGDIHDKNRGREGNFESALDVIRYFRDKTDISLSVGCTITKVNVWNVDELLEFCQNEGVYVRFRVAEFINRLYNEGEDEVIRNFTPEEAYHLATFFKKLELRYEQNQTVKRTYRSIRNMLSGESGRSIGCPYQSRAVVLDCRGQMQYCAPKSNIIGNAFQESASVIWKENLPERRRILREECTNCIHDYHSPITTSELLSQYQGSLSKRFLTLDNAMWVSDIFIDQSGAS